MIKLKNIHKNERCFIVGNGPSVNNQDLSHLKKEIIFCSNQYFLNKQITWFPQYYFVEDRNGFEVHLKEINKLTINSIRFFEDIQKNRIDNNKNTYYCKIFRDRDNIKFSLDPNNKIYSGYCVTYFQLQLAFYMGFKYIYLIGIDHSIGHFVSEDIYHKKSQHNELMHNINKKAYIIAKNIFEQNDKYILNSTLGGNLEVFNRVNYESLF